MYALTKAMVSAAAFRDSLTPECVCVCVVCAGVYPLGGGGGRAARRPVPDDGRQRQRRVHPAGP